LDLEDWTGWNVRDKIVLRAHCSVPLASTFLTFDELRAKAKLLGWKENHIQGNFENILKSKYSCNVKALSLTLFLRRRVIRWESSGNLCTESVRLDSQFAMELAHALPHSSDPDADPPGLNLSKSFLRHSLPMILNFHTNLVRFASNTDQRGFASRMAMDVC
jgi:hypothetical protein